MGIKMMKLGLMRIFKRNKEHIIDVVLVLGLLGLIASVFNMLENIS